MKHKVHRAHVVSVFAVLTLLVIVMSGVAQQPVPAETGKKPAEKDAKLQDTQTQDVKTDAKTQDTKTQNAKTGPKLPFALTVKTRPILNISLKAEKASMADVAQELSKRLKTPIFLGTERQKEPLTIEFSELTLEPALQLLSPTVYVDYELDSGGLEQPKALGIFLFDENQGEPPITAVVHGSSQSMLIEGDTEEGIEPATEEEKKKLEDQPLRITYQNYQLSVKAKKQPLPLVLLKIGEQIGIPVDIQDERMDIVDADISKLSVEDAVRRISPNVKLFVRADLTRAERRVLRMVLPGPTKSAQQGHD